MAARYQTVAIDGLRIFYRDGGPRDGPAILLLHGLPSSSRMFEPLFERLTDDFRQDIDVAERDVFAFEGVHCDAIVANVLTQLESLVS